MNRISSEVSIFCLWTYWIYRATCSKRDCVSYTTGVAAPLTKAVKFALPILVYTGCLAKNQFWLAATRKKRIRKQPNFFWNMCPKPFSWLKNKGKLFFSRSREDRSQRERRFKVIWSVSNTIVRHTEPWFLDFSLLHFYEFSFPLSVV